MKIEATLQVVGGTARLQATIDGNTAQPIRFDSIGETADAAKMVMELLHLAGVKENS